MFAAREMPCVDIESLPLTEEQKVIARQVVKGKKGQIRASRPKDGEAYYVWRMVVLSVSPNPRHHCMPVMADMEIPDDKCEHIDEDYNFMKRGRYCKEYLDPIEKAIVNAIPKDRWYGINRWSKAFYG